MQIADTGHLDAERAAILEAFDAVWIADRGNPWSRRARIAVRCAKRICDANTTHLIGSWRGFYVAPGGRPAGRFIVA